MNRHKESPSTSSSPPPASRVRGGVGASGPAFGMLVSECARLRKFHCNYCESFVSGDMCYVALVVGNDIGLYRWTPACASAFNKSWGGTPTSQVAELGSAVKVIPTQAGDDVRDLQWAPAQVHPAMLAICYTSKIRIWEYDISKRAFVEACDGVSVATPTITKTSWQISPLKSLVCSTMTGSSTVTLPRRKRPADIREHYSYKKMLGSSVTCVSTYCADSGELFVFPVKATGALPDNIGIGKSTRRRRESDCLALHCLHYANPTITADPPRMQRLQVPATMPARSCRVHAVAMDADMGFIFVLVSADMQAHSGAPPSTASSGDALLDSVKSLSQSRLEMMNGRSQCAVGENAFNAIMNVQNRQHGNGTQPALSCGVVIEEIASVGNESSECIEEMDVHVDAESYEGNADVVGGHDGGGGSISGGGAERGFIHSLPGTSLRDSLFVPAEPANLGLLGNLSNSNAFVQLHMTPGQVDGSAPGGDIHASTTSASDKNGGVKSAQTPSQPSKLLVYHKDAFLREKVGPKEDTQTSEANEDGLVATMKLFAEVDLASTPGDHNIAPAMACSERVRGLPACLQNPDIVATFSLPRSATGAGAGGADASLSPAAGSLASLGLSSSTPLSSSSSSMSPPLLASYLAVGSSTSRYIFVYAIMYNSKKAEAADRGGDAGLQPAVHMIGQHTLPHEKHTCRGLEFVYTRMGDVPALTLCALAAARSPSAAASVASASAVGAYSTLLMQYPVETDLTGLVQVCGGRARTAAQAAQPAQEGTHEDGAPENDTIKAEVNGRTRGLVGRSGEALSTEQFLQLSSPVSRRKGGGGDHTADSNCNGTVSAAATSESAEMNARGAGSPQRPHHEGIPSALHGADRSASSDECARAAVSAQAAMSTSPSDATLTRREDARDLPKRTCVGAVSTVSTNVLLETILTQNNALHATVQQQTAQIADLSSKIDLLISAMHDLQRK